MLRLREHTRDRLHFEATRHALIVKACVVSFAATLLTAAIVMFNFQNTRVDCSPDGKGTFTCQSHNKLLFNLIDVSYAATNVTRLVVEQSEQGRGRHQLFFQDSHGKNTPVTYIVTNQDHQWYNSVADRFNGSFEVNPKLRLDITYERQQWAGKLVLVLWPLVILFVLYRTLRAWHRPLMVSFERSSRALHMRKRSGQGKPEEIPFMHIASIREPTSQELFDRFLPKWAKKRLPSPVEGVTATELGHFAFVLQPKQGEPRFITIPDRLDLEERIKFFQFAKELGLNKTIT